MKKWMVGTAALLLVLLIITVAVAMAADNANRSGTKDDPLVSQSYLSSLQPKFIKDITDELSGVKTAYIKDMDEKYQQIVVEIDKRLAELLKEGADIDMSDPAFIDAVARAVLAQMDDVPAGDGYSGYRRVELRANETVTGSIGMEVVLRLGTATGVNNTSSSSNPAMISTTDATNLNGGVALKVNHSYLLTIDGNGFKAGSGGCTVFIRGSYTRG
jgi:predicted outer membrane protein